MLCIVILVRVVKWWFANLWISTRSQIPKTRLGKINFLKCRIWKPKENNNFIVKKLNYSYECEKNIVFTNGNFFGQYFREDFVGRFRSLIFEIKILTSDFVRNWDQGLTSQTEMTNNKSKCVSTAMDCYLCSSLQTVRCKCRDVTGQTHISVCKHEQ